MAYFDHFADIENPNRWDLIDFVRQSGVFLIAVIQDELDAGPTRDVGLFNDRLRAHAAELVPDLKRAFNNVCAAIEDLPYDSHVLAKHGLVGPPQRFKLAAIAHIDASLASLGIKEWIKKTLEQIDNILESAFKALESARSVQFVENHQQITGLIDIGMGTIITEVKKTIEILIG